MERTKEYDEITGIELKYKNYFDFTEFEKLDFDEKHQFLIEKKIILKKHKVKYRYHCAINSSRIGFKFENEFEFDVSYIYNSYWYEINKEITDEYYDYLFTRIETESIYCDTYTDIRQLESKIKFLSIDKKNEILSEIYDDNALIYGNFGLELDYLNEPGAQHNNWKDLITNVFEKELYAYLSGFTLTYDEDSIINLWIKVRETSSIMSYCKSKLEEIKKESTTNKEQKDNTTTNNKNSKINLFKNNEVSNYPLIFVSLGKEIFFNYFLKSFKIIDENENLINEDLIQTHCDAFYLAVRELENDFYIETPDILQRGRIKAKFQKMIIEKYNLNTTKLSDGLKHTNKVIYFIKKHL